MVQRREACGLQGPFEAAMPGARHPPQRSQARKKDLGQQALPDQFRNLYLDLFPLPWNQLQSLLCGPSGANRSRFAETCPPELGLRQTMKKSLQVNFRLLLSVANCTAAPLPEPSAS